MENEMTNTLGHTGQIDNIMFQMEEMNLIPIMKGDFNIVDEMRSHFGEEKFLDFLKDTVRVWDMNIETK
tara:strand:- start:81 stop:287 length:207 start_codon:yes stop_codon:yes gene_type:complete